MAPLTRPSGLTRTNHPSGRLSSVGGRVHGFGSRTRCYAAFAQNMVDGVATFDDVIRKMRCDAKGNSKPGASRLAQAQRALSIAGSAQ